MSKPDEDLRREVETALQKHVRDGTVRGHILLDDAVTVAVEMVMEAMNRSVDENAERLHLKVMTEELYAELMRGANR